jgi:hypothetical protein
VILRRTSRVGRLPGCAAGAGMLSRGRIAVAILLLESSNRREPAPRDCRPPSASNSSSRPYLSCFVSAWVASVTAACHQRRSTTAKSWRDSNDAAAQSGAGSPRRAVVGDAAYAALPCHTRGIACSVASKRRRERSPTETPQRHSFAWGVCIGSSRREPWLGTGRSVTPTRPRSSSDTSTACLACATCFCAVTR